MTKIIGLTGGIGSGKTSILKEFKTLGIPCYQADLEAKRLMEESEELIGHITKLFGLSSYKENRLNREFITSIVFNNPDALKQLTNVVHPAVEKDFTDWLTQTSAAYVIKEVAILFEYGGEKKMDATILTTAPMEDRIVRVINRDKCSREEVLARMKNQWDDEKKIPLADFVIENNNWEETIKQVKYIDKQIRAMNHEH